MPKDIELKLLPEQAFDEAFIKTAVARGLGRSPESIGFIQALKRSIDARKQVVYNLLFRVYDQNEALIPDAQGFDIKNKALKHRVAIVGFGPAGIFAAFALLEQGIQPIVIERGKTVQKRRRDLAALNKSLIVNPESNYCFGEGGAGTYSDGKLYTRSKKRGDVLKVLQSFIAFGADPDIRINTHPHIGTNKLPGIIENMREAILQAGGEIHFESKLTDFEIQNGQITHLIVNEQQQIQADAVILATGHSARDVFELLHQKQIAIEAKPFALGLRIEHPQSLIDQIQYHQAVRGAYLPPAAYSLVTQAKGHGVFSFCMCPGGIIAPASSNTNELVVNGWSPSKRNGQFANSGMVVTVDPVHWQADYGNGPLAALAFQKAVELKAYQVHNSIKAPAQRMDDFINRKTSTDLPDCSYIPGVGAYNLHEVLPRFIGNALADGLAQFGQKMRGYRSNDALLVGVESRTSSPVRIPRDKILLNHPELSNLFPCGEGAGYAGGIMSAALDGIACANAALNQVLNA
jgi:hypothetical protein